MLRYIPTLSPQARDLFTDITGVVALCMVIGTAMIAPGII